MKGTIRSKTIVLCLVLTVLLSILASCTRIPSTSSTTTKEIEKTTLATSVTKDTELTAATTTKPNSINEYVSQTVTGYITDVHCFVKKPVPGSDSKMCLQMPACAATGYGIAVLQNDGSYKFSYFDGSFAPNASGAQVTASKLINDTIKKDQIFITITGKVSGESKTSIDGVSYPVLNVSTLAETNVQALTGYVIDEHCFMKKPDPSSDSKTCLQMPTCAATGFGVAVMQPDNTYKFYYFDGNFAPAATDAQSIAAKLINDTIKKDHVYISVTGVLLNDTKIAPDGLTYPVFKVSSMNERVEQGS